MPKINAKTLAEQRSWRRNQLIDAAAEIALESGAKALTVSEVAKRAKVSRTAIYDYFDSTDDLIAELVANELNRYANFLALACNQETAAMDKVEAWLRAGLLYVADGRHLLIKALNATSFPDSRKAEIGLAHRKMLAPLRDALIKVAINEEQAIEYIKSVSDAAAIRIERGYPAEQEIEIACTFLIAGLRQLVSKTNA